MRVRALDSLHDWQFGKGANDYRRNRAAVAQNINTRLMSFLGDCFFDNEAGIDWFNLLGNKDQTALNLAISAVILNTQYVTGLKRLSVILGLDRHIQIRYEVLTSYGPESSDFNFDVIV